jgi:succinyl-CoA synthetase beta subunit
MLLYEFEGKQLFKNCGINVPKSQLISELKNQLISIKPPLVLKAQVLSGKRAEGGGIVRVDRGQVTGDSLRQLFGKIVNGEKVERILVEELVDVESEYYLSFSYSTQTRGPVLTFGKGGTGIEQIGADSFPVDILKGYEGKNVPKQLNDTAKKLWEVFIKYDCELVEVNPLVIDKNGRAWALDSKVILDDDADFRREIKFPQRNLFGRSSTEAEIEARKIDQGDHRGTAGSVYWDLDGEIKGQKNCDYCRWSHCCSGL